VRTGTWGQGCDFVIARLGPRGVYVCVRVCVWRFRAGDVVAATQCRSPGTYRRAFAFFSGLKIVATGQGSVTPAAVAGTKIAGAFAQSGKESLPRVLARIYPDALSHSLLSLYFAARLQT
jgi:hypothetical protein